MSAETGSERDRLEKEQALRIAQEVAFALFTLSHKIHRLNANFYVDLETGKRLEFTRERAASKAMLIVSEVAEMVEGMRTSAVDTHLTDRNAEEVEAADVLIRLLDYCAWRDLDLVGAVREKLSYNLRRNDHKLEAMRASNGKKI